MGNGYIHLPLSGSPSWKPPVPTFIDLPAVGNSIGDARVAEDTSLIYVWNGSVWENSSSSGTVVSVGLLDGSTSPIYQISNSPVTSSGSLTFTLLPESANTMFAGPSSGSATQPTFRSLVASDIPNLSSTYVTQSEVGAANGVASLNASGKIPTGQLPADVFQYQGTWNPSTNTPTLQDSTGSPGYVYWVSTAYASPIAGLNNASMYNFQIGDLTLYNGSQWELTTPAAGVQSVNGAQGVVTFSYVNYVALSVPGVVYTVTGSPITGSGTLTLSLNTQSARTFFAGPTSGSPSQPTFRSIVASDLPLTYIENSGLFGDGSDGSYSASSGNLSLARDMYYTNITLTGSATLQTNGFRLFCTGTLNIANAGVGAISNQNILGSINGSANGTGGAARSMPNGFTVPSVIAAPSAGANGGASSGSNAATVSTSSIQVRGGLGGAGSNGGNAGGNGGTFGGTPQATSAGRLFLDVILSTSPSIPGTGGGGGKGDGSVSGGGGGAGGVSGGCIWINAMNITRGGSTAIGAIQTKGVTGGNGGTPTTGAAGGGGAGGGGGGGFVYIITNNLLGSTATGAVDVTGGSGGNGGSGSGGAGGAAGGSSGQGGVFYLINLGAQTILSNSQNATVSGSPASGSTGGSGGTATVSQYNI